MSTLLVETHDGIGEIILNRPAKLNAMNPAFFAELPAAVADLEADADVRVILVRARGNHFSAGLDLREMAPGSQGVHSVEDITPLQSGFLALAETKKPTIAAIQGYCIGGGLDLISACDIRLASSSAIFSLREVKLGIVADLGSLSLLAESMPWMTLADLAFTGRDVKADEAKAIGLVKAVFETNDDLANAAQTMAEQISANPPLALQATKELLIHRRRSQLRYDLAAAALQNVTLMQSADMAEALRALLEQRTPHFRGI